MSVIALTLPGEFVDAYVYADHLLAWDRSGAIVAWRMQDLATTVAEAGLLPSWLSQAAFDDNRRLDGSSIRQVYTDESIAIDVAPTLFAYTDMQKLAVYDILIARFTIFVSTSEGLFSLPLLRGRASDQLQGEPTERMSGRVLTADYHFGSIVAASGKRGTWALVNEFGFSFETPRHVEQFTSGTAARAGWFGHTLYEVDDLGEHRFYSATLREGSRPPGAKKKNPRVVVGVDEYSDESVYLPVLGVPSGAPGNGPAPQTFPLRSSIVRRVDGQLWISPVGRWDGDFIQRGGLAVIADHVKDVWNVGETAGGFAVETEGGVFGIERERYLQIGSQPVISMRTYPDSRRYRRIVTTTSSAGLTVSCMTGQHPYPRGMWWGSEDNVEFDEEVWGDLKGLRVAPPGTPGE